MNATLDVIQGLHESGAIPDGDARAYVRQAIAAGVSRFTRIAHTHLARGDPHTQHKVARLNASQTHSSPRFSARTKKPASARPRSTATDVVRPS